MELVPASSSGEPQGFSSCDEQQHLDLKMFFSKDMLPSSSSPREHMFDKVVTPSDVGKLNRLVIPKQHAEKYFPLDSTNSDKGLFLNFEDSAGKSWRFRYSYWTSSQSYVMTKGWSRFVKDKKLDAGDTVSFLRSKLDSSSLFIDWRRSPNPPLPDHHTFSFHRPSATVPWTPLLLPVPNPQHHPHHQYWMSHAYGPSSSNYHTYGNNYVFRNHHQQQTTEMMSRAILNHQDESRRGGIDGSMVLESVPVVHGKKLRLFGVNMETESATVMSHSDSSDDPSSNGRSIQQQPNNKGKPSSNSHSMSLDFHI